MNLIFPTKILDQHLVCLGKTGAGKSSALRHIVEWLLAHKKRVCIIDPKGDWWGLKWSADGKSEGFPVVAFGDFKGRRKGDIPINDRSGHQVAELVASGNRPCMIGFAGWTITAMTEFWIHFAEGIFNQNQGELYIIGDEFHNFAPKGSLKGKEGRGTMSLHWSNRLLSEGRGIGIVCLLASQRPAKVHNDTLTSCETLVAMRVTHAADRRAYEEWIDGCGDETQGQEVIDSVASMARGQAFVWSPEINYGPERIKFPMFQTFDSFAPPQLQKAVVENNWDNVDLDAVKAKLAAVIEEAKANDPAELKRQVRELEHNLKVKVQEMARWQDKQPEVKPAEPEKVLVIKPEDRQLVQNAIGLFDKMETGIRAHMEEARSIYAELNALGGRLSVLISNADNDALRRTKPALMRQVRETLTGPTRPPSPTRPIPSHNGTLDNAQQKILDTIAMLNRRGLTPNREMVARWMDIHPHGGRYGSNLARLREEGYLNGFDLTTKATAYELPEGLAGCLEPLDRSERAIVEVLDTSRASFTRETLAEVLGIHPNGGRYGSSLARLRTMGLIPERGEIKLTPAAYQ